MGIGSVAAVAGVAAAEGELLEGVELRVVDIDGRWFGMGSRDDWADLKPCFVVVDRDFRQYSVFGDTG